MLQLGQPQGYRIAEPLAPEWLALAPLSLCCLLRYLVPGGMLTLLVDLSFQA